ncbi:glycoside hydrolase family 3 N-terminal domain-containing protein [Actinoplanes couchii]|uniref:beta-glucosidase n=1 Tax=Actinoplanes couchii TaxID=403638 RepID=A0ABQ3XP30_9ACTN|nr:glycoside hydrolase family 3 N-terminal domain-containing protein [Actinoplanes couchii]MDR6318638.1 beta-glucosidase [Actinoplanes couchii]GID60246.1 beta-glucosidase [Actinoplanes couchii]
MDLTTLLGRMTLDQKVAQLTGLSVRGLLQSSAGSGGSPLDELLRQAPHGLGHLSMIWRLGDTDDSLRQALADIQERARDLTPYGIGVLFHGEGANGLVFPAGLQFPTPWGQAATWDPQLTGRASSVTAAQMDRIGIPLMFSPVLDLARDPRWGRVHETYGEDPELVAQFAVGFVRGVQETGSNVVATGKHFLGYGHSEGGLNKAATHLGPRALLDDYAEPFRRAVAEAGLPVVMNSYNTVDGVPAAANRWLLTEVLRDRLGFDGLTVSDYGSIDMLRSVHHTAATAGEAGRQAITAGLDVELPRNDCFSALVTEVEQGRLSEQVIDRAVLRVLTLKDRLGLIPSSTVPARTAADRDLPAEAARAGRELAERGLTLLANDGTLPLRPNARIAVIGPVADELRIHFGAYTGVADAELAVGIRAILNQEIPGVTQDDIVMHNLFATRTPGVEPLFEEVARRLHPNGRSVVEALRELGADVTHTPLGNVADPTPVDADAVTTAVQDADVIVAVVGERTGWLGNHTAGEGITAVSPSVPGNQQDLIRRAAATGKPVVTVVVSGRPLVMPDIARDSAAVLLAPLLSEYAGTAVARALLGAVNPSGRLPSTFPRHLGQIPIYHGHQYGSGYAHPTGVTSDYVDLDDQRPLYAFGHGLSYSTFTAGEPEFTADGVLRARLTVTNTSTVDGETVVQLYARDEVATVVRPVRRLLAFTRIALAAGESREVLLEAPLERLFYTFPDGSRGLEAGEVTLMAGFSSDDLPCSATVTVPAAGDAHRR